MAIIKIQHLLWKNLANSITYGTLTMDASGSGIDFVLLRRYSPLRCSRTTYAPRLTPRASCLTCLSRSLSWDPLRQSASMARWHAAWCSCFSRQKKSPSFEGLFLIGAFNQNRTGDLILTMDALYRLSYKGGCSWSGWRESNPRGQLGKLKFCHWTTSASFLTHVKLYKVVLYVSIQNSQIGCFGPCCLKCERSTFKHRK